MNPSNSPVSIDMIKVQERGYRRRVDHEPMDICARVNLAWCLLLEAMHQAGRENLLAVLRERGAVADIPNDGGFRLDSDAQNLLRECLKQMCAVCELTRDPRDIAEVERMRYLVTISGAEAALREADDEAARWLMEMAKAILSATPVEPVHRYRRVPRDLS